MRIDRRAPVLGEHTLDVLREFGIEDARIDALLASATVVQHAAP
jgi:crotonobetainyl-CoA:carnitine CoA-transferase CaiB-like acyl-CoA transferase